ncbi:MAG: L,D-transpeptidase family protein [Alphaproteobacteria bacterium]|nr:L,D-transpeptidase family protein [Alphaproteobacteria bacterium]
MILTVRPEGRLEFPGLGSFACALGRSGISRAKREGDGATPAGLLPLRQAFFRPDRVASLMTRLPLLPLHPNDGWCDDPTHADYNRLVRLPFAARHEKMWREDGLYDLGAVLGHNDDPPAPHLGSAIFLHVASPDMKPTEGCVALSLSDLRRVLERLGPGDAIEIVD